MAEGFVVLELLEELRVVFEHHWTPRDAVKLMASLMFLPVADKIESGTYLLYDCACGTGGMLTVAEETLQQTAKDHGKQVATHLYGQEINPAGELGEEVLIRAPALTLRAAVGSLSRSARLRRVHVVAELVGGEPELGFEAEVGGGVFEV